MGYGVVRAGMPATTLEKIHSYCRLTLPTLPLDLIFLLQTVSQLLVLRLCGVLASRQQWFFEHN